MKYNRTNKTDRLNAKTNFLTKKGKFDQKLFTRLTKAKEGPICTIFRRQ